MTVEATAGEEVVVQEIGQAKEELLRKEMLTFLLIIIPQF